MQVAAYWAEQKLDDFAVVVQPFFSGSNASLPLEFLSTVSHMLVSMQVTICHSVVSA